ncbi:MAG: hypothetical protein JNJ58_05735 [Chitinophagaceae bacterium]|nr:hypothetical protein [Chitinophagaceae bacterium]
MVLPFYKKLLSYFIPVQLQTLSGDKHPRLKVQLYMNHIMLSTPDAIYSFGTLYSPFRITFAAIKDSLPNVKQFLLLGTGMGSALQILQKEYQCYPKSILVDHDATILSLSMQYMNLNSRQNVQWLNSDARLYIETCDEYFDLIGVDIFVDMDIPYYYRTEDFYRSCRMKLNEKGICIFNTIPINPGEAEETHQKLRRVFSKVDAMTQNRNVFYLCMH